jgi:hypothetical protein
MGPKVGLLEGEVVGKLNVAFWYLILPGEFAREESLPSAICHAVKHLAYP